MEMRNVPRNGQPRQGITGCSVTNIGRNSADDLNTIRFGAVNDRPTAHSIDRDAIDKVGVHRFLPGADLTGKETQCASGHSGEPEPADLCPDGERVGSWEEWYRRIWQLKVARWSKNNG